MLDGADVTNVDDRESIVELAAYWPLGFFALLRGGGGGGGGGRLLFASLFGKCLMAQTRW